MNKELDTILFDLVYRLDSHAAYEDWTDEDKMRFIANYIDPFIHYFNGAENDR